MSLTASSAAVAQIGVSITIAPPALPVYEQPLCPGDGYIWTPGYWAWDDDAGGYYWVPGTWVLPPSAGLLWTPGYWTWESTRFVFVRGYWGPVVGFYGGIDYGFGYPGHGFYGGRWTNGHFFYNRSVSRVNVTVVHNTYIENVQVNRTPSRVSYHGKDGIAAQPTAREAAVARERHVEPTPTQLQHVQLARARPDLHAAANDGKPPVAATARPDALRNRVPSARAGGPSSGRAADAARGRAQPQSAAPPTRPERSPGDDGQRSAGADGQRSTGDPRADERAPPSRRTEAQPPRRPPATDDGDRTRTDRTSPGEQRKEQSKKPPRKKRDDDHGDR